MKSRWQLLAAALLLTLAVALAFGRRASRPEANFGYTPDATAVERFLSDLPKPTFAQAGAETIREAKGIDTFLYRAAAKAHQQRYNAPWVCGRQGIGDCVAWGWMHGIWIAQAIDWETGRLAEPPLIPSTEAIYGGSRVEARGRGGDGTSPVGGWSDGSFGAAAAKFVREWGVVYREQVGGHDLRHYSAQRAKDWGAYGCGGQGDGGRLDAIASKHPAQHVALVTTWAEASAAIEAGFPVTVASMQGFASVTDQHGFAAASGQWAHEMCFVAVRYQKNGSPSDGLLCLNSWGDSWIKYVGKFPADQPSGSFWVTRPVVERMLAQRDSFAVGSVAGFGWRDLHNGNWLSPVPPASSVRASHED